MNGTTLQSNTAQIEAHQAALRAALTTRRAAEVSLQRCKTTTSPAARRYLAVMQEQKKVAEARLHDVRLLSGAFEAAALASHFGERRLAKYIIRNAAGREMIDIALIHRIQIAFFQFAIAEGANWLDEGTTYFYDDPVTEQRYLVEVKA